MDAGELKRRARELVRRLGDYRWVLLVITAGAVLLLWPSGEIHQTQQGSTAAQGESFDLEALEKRLADTLKRIDGAGEVSVMLTVKSGMELVTAQDVELTQSGQTAETVVISTGSGKQEVVVLTQRYPAFQGALVVCSGGDDPAVMLLVTRAVSSLTGLSTGKIVVCKGN